MLMTPTPTLTPAERYLATARDAGCPEDQIRNFLRAGIVLQPRQLAASAAARQCDRAGGPTWIGYGGARGGAKSHWGMSQVAADDCQRVPGLKFLYLRKVGKSGSEAIEDLRRTVLRGLPHKYRAGSSITFDNGSRIVLGHFQNDRDIDNYLGLEYDGALVEEATQLKTRKITDIDTCVRTSSADLLKRGWRPRTYFTYNPGGVSHSFIKDTFIRPFRDRRETRTRFVQATVRDNVFVPGYREKLERLTGWQREAWLDGNWDIAAGQFFTTWRHDVHVRPLDAVPDHWRVWLGFDYGTTHYTSVHLLAQDDDGFVWIVDEHAERRWLPERHVGAILAMLRRWAIDPRRIESTYAGHDCFNRNHTGATIADNYAALGLPLARADVDRINGAGEWLRRLGDCEAGIPPTLAITPSCVRLIECLPDLEHDELRPEDVQKVDCDEDGRGGDDAYDSARYGLMAAARGPATWGASPVDPEWRG